jgi:hypothetical protein
MPDGTRPDDVDLGQRFLDTVLPEATMTAGQKLMNTFGGNRFGNRDESRGSANSAGAATGIVDTLADCRERLDERGLRRRL